MTWYLAMLTGVPAVGSLVLVIGLVTAITYSVSAGAADQNKTGLGILGAGCALALGAIAVALVVTR